MGNKDTSKLQNALFAVLERRNTEFKLEEDRRLEILSDKYQLDTYLLKQSISEHIKELSIYDINNKQAGGEEIIAPDPVIEVQDGKWFDAETIIDLRKQLYLESELINPDKIISAQIISLLHDCIGNGLYYLFDDVTLYKLFDYAIDLLLCGGKSISYENDTGINALISAVKHFNLRYRLDYELKDGSLLLTNIAHKKIHESIEMQVKEIGAFNVLRLLFECYLDNPYFTFYDLQMDRYLINRSKTICERQNSTPAPYQYLIQLALKHLKDKDENVPIYSLLKYELNQLFSKLIEDSKAYVNLLQIYNSSVFSDMMINYKAIPKYVSDNILFETLCIPSQYSPEFVVMLIRKLYLPEIKTQTFFFDFYKPVYLLSLIEATLEYGSCSTITIDSLYEKTKIERNIIKGFLEHFSQKVGDVNSKFNAIFEETNTRECPLIQIGESKFLLMSAHFCGYAFCERIYQTLKRVSKGAFDGRLGKRIEVILKELIKEKGYDYKSGEYAIGIDSEQAECDIVMETDDKILFVELKKRPLPEEFEYGDVVKVFKCLGEGMLTAQKQAFKHRLYLENYGQIDFGSSKVVKGDKLIHTISVCLPEYNFFTTKNIAKKLVESIVYASYRAFEPDRESELNRFNELGEDFAALVNKYVTDVGETNIHRLFFFVSFRSLQQILIALYNSYSVEEFVDNIVCDSSLVLGSLDYYSSLKSHLSKYKH